MKIDDRQLQEIAEHEKWLAQALPAGDSLSTEHLRLHVQVELGEQWLRRQWKPLDAEPISASLWTTVQSAIAESSAGEMVRFGSSPKMWRRFLPAGLGLAAMIALSVSIFQAGQTNQPDFDLTITAFEEPVDPENFDEEFENVSAELDDLLASIDETEWEDALYGL
jgi:hypothetical protein